MFKDHETYKLDYTTRWVLGHVCIVFRQTDALADAPCKQDLHEAHLKNK